MLQDEGIHILCGVLAIDAIDVAVAGNYVPLIELAAIGFGQVIHRDFGALRQEALVLRAMDEADGDAPADPDAAGKLRRH